VVRDTAGAVRIYKAPSVPADPSEGVLGVLRLAAQQLDLPLSALLRDCALFVHGSTVATNTILEKKGAKVGLLTTAGFRDVGKGPGSRAGEFIEWLTIPEQKQAVVDDVLRIRTHPLVPSSIPIYGYIYDVKSGRLIEVEAATRAGTTS